MKKNDFILFILSTLNYNTTLMESIHTQILSSDHPQAIATALATLQAGGLVAFPTDTVYGVACLAFDEAGIEKLYEAKDRDTSKAIAVLLGSLEQLPQVCSGLSQPAQNLAQRFWPGALTLVVARHPSLPNNISAFPTVGVRMPDHAFAIALLQASGPLATTSANLSGQANPFTAGDVIAQLGGRIHLVVDGGPTPGGIPSTVVDCTVVPPKILRQGAISESQIQAILLGE
jgi:L-threonylcarbamoyladenylate synthase